MARIPAPPQTTTRDSELASSSITRDGNTQNIVDNNGDYLVSHRGNKIYHSNNTIWQETT